MKTIIIALFMLPFAVLAQHTTKRLSGPPTRQEEEIAEKHYKCLHRDKFTTDQRLSFFPFNTYKTIKIISFENPSEFSNILPVEKQVLDLSKVEEIKTLSKSEIDSLTDILFNVGYTARNGRIEIENPGGKCFNPRNAVLFMGTDGKVKEYIEYCFECDQAAYSSNKIITTEICEQKYELLKNYFISQGIKIGTIEKIRHY